MLAKDLVFVGERLARAASVRLNSRMNSRLRGGIRTADRLGLKVRSKVAGKPTLRMGIA
jgi:hypothetical protein